MSEKKRIEIKALMAGLFYERPAPDQPAYVQVGSQVKKKDVLGLMETMKVFQKIKSPASGTVVEIKVQNEAPVKDGDVMFVLEKD
jgi:acetyl-CoA carboxylase biotin carboxyl carrier protein